MVPSLLTERIVDLDADPISRKPDAPCKDLDGSLGDLGIRRLLVRWRQNLDVLRDRFDPFDTASGPFGRHFIGVARDETGQGDDAVMHADADMGGIDPRLKIEFVEYVLPQLMLVDHASLHGRAGMLIGLHQRRVDPGQGLGDVLLAVRRCRSR